LARRANRHYGLVIKRGELRGRWGAISHPPIVSEVLVWPLGLTLSPGLLAIADDVVE